MAPVTPQWVLLADSQGSVSLALQAQPAPVEVEPSSQWGCSCPTSLPEGLSALPKARHAAGAQ